MAVLTSFVTGNFVAIFIEELGVTAAAVVSLTRGLRVGGATGDVTWVSETVEHFDSRWALRRD